jgi:glycosyltransferase involved in cell wall biosynthesis
MKVTFVIPFLWFTGGLRVILEYSRHLMKRGHRVTIAYPVIPYRFGRSLPRYLVHVAEALGWNIKHRNRPKWTDVMLRPTPIPPFGQAWERYLPEADVVVATAWPSAYTVNGLTSRKGKKAYLIQDYEVWAGAPADKVDRTFSLPLTPIVISSWLLGLVQEISGRPKDGIHVVANGINLQQFHNPNKVYHRPRRILMVYRTARRKGLADGIRAFELARAQYPDIQLIMMGLKRGAGVPHHAEFHKNPGQDELRKIYSSCDILVFPSWQEGCGLPPMEAMACQCAVVATNVGAVPDYAIAGQTALVSEPQNPKALARNIMRLLDDEDELMRISQAGYERIKQFTWERATEQLEQALMSLPATPAPIRKRV